MSGRSRRDIEASGSSVDPSWLTDFNRATTISSSTVHRYGRRLWPRPSFRDSVFWARLRSHGAPHATDSHRDRERMLRAIRDGENRRIRNEESATSLNNEAPEKAQRIREKKRNSRVLPFAEEERSLVPEEISIAKNVLTVKSVDLHINENTRRHRTFEYDCTERSNDPRLVVRRGEVFIMIITFQRPWHSRYDELFLQFSVGDQPNEKGGTLEKFQLTETDSTWHNQKSRWAAKIAKQEGPRLTIYVYTAPDAIIGEWECQVTTSFLNAPNKENFTFTGVPDIYVLFNPWCPDDQVYYTERPADLDEYVLNEYGCVFMGVAGDIGQKPWYYGQFQDGILDICMTILRMAFDMEISKDMGDAITVARKLSRIINNSGRDPGLITGNWSNSYADGTAPTSWKGSVQILKQYARTKTAVKYGQCWVFSHVLTTVCRALGLPCRSLTNFQSAHDRDKTATIDNYKDENGEDLSEYNADSIWNFHCWNDVWINRPDLDSKSGARGRYSGWHALDATPQEKSEGRYQCGPSPLKAIKNGELKVGYDTGFIFAEVNGELCTWMLPKNGSRHDIKLLSHDPNAIGKTISTKIPDGQPSMGSLVFGAKEVHEQRLDITHLYKYPEGSEEERAAVQLAVGRGLGAKVFETPGGVSLEVMKPNGVMVGRDFTFSAVFANSSRDVRRLDIRMSVFPIDYRGERLGWDKVAYSKANDKVLRPRESRRFDLPVSELAYLKQCDKSMAMMLQVSAKVKGQDRPVTKMEKMVMAIPDLKLDIAHGPIRRGHPFRLLVMVSNPLKRPLTGCRLEITGPAFPLVRQGFSQGDGCYVKAIKDIPPTKTTALNVDMQANDKPLWNNTREVEVSIISSQLPDMSGTLTFKLQA
ncbi:protein-glutamine gamma-glutamyltransferase k [Plakobranchus ocellatus]|uniref:Protein-glutamine gamma-glutamyltransferase k n=1 Tax=Plakobranchus ocellatus TaxID=259542 RepID=A0AAV4DX46_9GAST|nr:protein-glutamine gamma-glutamyltransferase k [Plakobranchus ocellatus]